MTKQTQHMLQALGIARKELLHLYWHLIQIPPYDLDEVTVEDINEFCQQLVDYTAFWHLLARATLQDDLQLQHVNERGQERHDVAIADTIDTILVFDEFCAKHENPSTHRRWHELLSLIGETMARRFELEDWLIINSDPNQQQGISA